MQLIPVHPDEIDNIRQSRRGRVSYPILKMFLESNQLVSKLDRTGMQQSMMSLTASLNAYVRSHELPVRIFQRTGELYLMRTDVDEEGNFLEPSVALQREKAGHDLDEATPINAEEVAKRFEQEKGNAAK